MKYKIEKLKFPPGLPWTDSRNLIDELVRCANITPIQAQAILDWTETLPIQIENIVNVSCGVEQGFIKVCRCEPQLISQTMTNWAEMHAAERQRIMLMELKKRREDERRITEEQQASLEIQIMRDAEIIQKIKAESWELEKFDQMERKKQHALQNKFRHLHPVERPPSKYFIPLRKKIIKNRNHG